MRMQWFGQLCVDEFTSIDFTQGSMNGKRDLFIAMTENNEYRYVGKYKVDESYEGDEKSYPYEECLANAREVTNLLLTRGWITTESFYDMVEWY